VPFFTISGSDFVEMFVGVGASRVRDMFEQAKKNAPCIIFIDEIDAVGRHRGAGLGGGNDEREQTLNQLLVEMDGFEANEGVILIAATNRPDVLDPALLRPGRFDRQVVVPLPDVNGPREDPEGACAQRADGAECGSQGPGPRHARVLRCRPDEPGQRGGAAAARRNKRLVTMAEFEDAKDKVMMGAERRSTAMTQEEKKLTAYHEAGHAIVALNVPAADPVHKATIIPRGRALGMVMQLPEADRYSMSYKWMVSRLAIMMGGRVAEELTFGKENITSGASSDIVIANGDQTRSAQQRWSDHGAVRPPVRQARPARLYGREPAGECSWNGHSVAAEAAVLCVLQRFVTKSDCILVPMCWIKRDTKTNDRDSTGGFP
jgi:cell division protease FtsH